jgi:hypothetical protein
VLIPVVYLFGGDIGRQKRDGYASLAHRNHGETQGQGNLYWFGPPESKTLHPVLDCITSIVAGLHGRGVDGLLYPRGHPCPPYMGDGQGRWTGVQVGYNRETYL